jgi:hypothetical protein
MLVDYTTVLNRPCVSVEGPTQQGIKSVVEVTPTSGVTSDGSSNLSLRLRLLLKLRAMARTATNVVVVLVQVTMQSLQLAGLTWHRATHGTLRQARMQKGDHRLTCSAPDTSYL